MKRNKGIRHNSMHNDIHKDNNKKTNATQIIQKNMDSQVLPQKLININK